MYFVIFILIFILLFVVSQQVTSELGRLFLKLTKSSTGSIHLLAIIFFPGVLIHELGHFLMASILFVHTGEIEFLPKIQEGGVKLGSVAIAHTDPFRRFLIGVAPIVSGMGILFLSSYYLTPLLPLSWKTIVFCYILFEIGNTMFSSKKDLEGALGLVLMLAFIGGCLFILGARIPSNIIAFFVQIGSSPLFMSLALWVGASLAVNVVVLAFLKFILR